MPTAADRWFAWLMSRISGPYDRLLAGRKRRLLSGLDGTIVEIGPGVGANLKYYRTGVSWIGFEPNPCMRPYYPQALDLREGSAESLDLPSGMADAVVSTLVLCSVRDIAACLNEALRVLKPGGRLVFIEHVAAHPGTGLRLAQRALQPIWSRCAGGCHPGRDTAAEIERAGFEHVDLERFRLPLGPIAPHIAGVAVR